MNVGLKFHHQIENQFLGTIFSSGKKQTQDRAAARQWQRSQPQYPQQLPPKANRHTEYKFALEELPGPIIEVTPPTFSLDAGRASGRRRRVLCTVDCNLSSFPRSITFLFAWLLEFCVSHGEGPLRILSLAVKRSAALCLRLGFWDSGSTIYWGPPHTHRVPQTTLFSRLARSSTMSRKGSLTIVLFCFTGTSPNVDSVCRWTSRDFDSVQSPQPPMELSFTPTNFLFPSPGSYKANISTWFAPIQSTGARSQSITCLDLKRSGRSSICLPQTVKSSFPAWILFNGCAFSLLRRLSGGLSYGTVVQSRSEATTMINGLSASYDWAWPLCATNHVSPIQNLLRPTTIKRRLIMAFMVLVAWVVPSEIPGGLSRISSHHLLSYLSHGLNLRVDSLGFVSILPSFSSEKCLLPPFLFSMKGDVLLVSLPSFNFSLSTVLSSCVAVCTGPEDAIEITLFFLVGESWLSTSPLCVTISQLCEFVLKALWTQLSFVSTSLSSSQEDLSILTSFSSVVYVFNQRGWIIPSCYCTQKS